MTPKSYRKNIAEGKNILVFSIIFAVIVRLVYYIFSDTQNIQGPSEGYLWNLISPLFENTLYSLIASSIIVAFLALMAAQINTRFTLIRQKTLLPPAIILFIFSCHPSFMNMSPAYVGALSIMLCTAISFASYNEQYKQGTAIKIGFTIALSSLFIPIILLYIPVFWIGLIMMRHFNGKALIASLLGIIIVYFPVFSFYVYINNLETFYEPFISTGLETLAQLPLVSLTPLGYSILGFMAVLFAIIVSDNYINQYKDKIKIRAYLSFLSFILILSFALSLLLNISLIANIYITLVTGSLLIAHFFALAEKKGTAIFFYLCLILSFIIALISFLPLS